MNILYGFLIFIHLLVSILLVVAVLMQRAKGGGLAGIAGGAAASAVFGGRTAATLIHKVTVILAVVFGINCILMGVVSKATTTNKSVTQAEMQQQTEENPLDFLKGSESDPNSGAVPAMPSDGEQAPAAGNPAPSTPAPATPTTPAGQ